MAASIVKYIRLHPQGFKFLKNQSVVLNHFCFNSNRASITRIRRLTYTRLYPTLMVLPNGSTIRMRYNVPQKIIKLPVDISQMSDEEKKRHMEKHKPKQTVVIEDDVEDDFSVDKYSHLWKKK